MVTHSPMPDPGGPAVPDLIRSGSEDGASSESTLSSFEGSPGGIPIKMTNGTTGAVGDGKHLVAPRLAAVSSTRHDTTGAGANGGVKSSKLHARPSTISSHASLSSGPLSHAEEGVDGTTEAYAGPNISDERHLTALEQAANYATLSHFTPQPLSDSLSQLRLSPARPEDRPHMPRTSSSLTARPGAPGTRSASSSTVATPAANIIDDPMKLSTVVDRLERGVESPVSSTSTGTVDNDTLGQAHVVASRVDGDDHARACSSSPSSNSALGGPEDIARASGVASPDSWRSLLPEHDPFYASEAFLAESQRRHRVSSYDGDSNSEGGTKQPAATPPFPRDASRESTISQSTSSFGGYSSSSRRLSSTSMASIHSSLSTPASSSYKSPWNSHKYMRNSALESWRSFLPENDPAAIRNETCIDDPEGHGIEDAGASSGMAGGTAAVHRSSGTIRAAGKTLSVEVSPARRHASFSAFERVEPTAAARGSSDTGHPIRSALQHKAAAVRSGKTHSDVAVETPDGEGQDGPTPTPEQIGLVVSSGQGADRSSLPMRRASGRGLATADAEVSSIPDSRVGSLQKAQATAPPRRTSSVSRAAMDADERDSWPSSGVNLDAYKMQRVHTESSVPGYTGGPVRGDTAFLHGQKRTQQGSGTTHASPPVSSDVSLATRVLQPANLRRPSLIVDVARHRYTLSVELTDCSRANISLSCPLSQTLKISVSNGRFKWEEDARFLQGDADFDSDEVKKSKGADNAAAGGSSGIRAAFDGRWLVVKVARRPASKQNKQRPETSPMSGVQSLASSFELSRAPAASTSPVSSASSSSAQTATAPALLASDDTFPSSLSTLT